MKRNLKFWTRFTWENMGVELSITAILAVMTVFGGEGLDLARFVVTVPYLLCIAAIFGMILINSGTQSLYIPLLVSMGETRRNVLMGFHYFRALVIAVTLGLCALIWLAVPGEVSSAGLDRALKKPDHFAQCMGQRVDVKLYRPVDGRKEATGVLTGYEDGAVSVDGVRFEKKDVAQVRLHVEF